MSRKMKVLEKDEQGYCIMSKSNLKIICEKDELYQNPELNDKLYLSHKSFAKIENLNEYVNLRALWLNNNVFIKIENLEYQVNLIQLFLNNNMIVKIENLENLKNLKTLDLSHNKISKIENLDKLTQLTDLDVSYNMIQNNEGIQNIAQMQSLTNVDLSFNLIELQEEETLSIMSKLKNLACLYLQGNPFVKEFRQYRKKFISQIPSLQFLDQKPVFPNERRLAEAWEKSGQQGEEQERFKIAKERDEANEKIALDIAEKNNNAYIQRQFILNAQEKKVSDLVEQVDQLKQTQSTKESTEKINALQIQLKKEQELLNYYRENKDSFNIIKLDPTAYQSIQRNEDGTVEIFNLTQEEAESVKQKQYYDKNIVQVKTKADLYREAQEQRQKVQAQLDSLNEQYVEQQDEIENQQKFIDYSQQFKSFYATESQIEQPGEVDIQKIITNVEVDDNEDEQEKVNQSELLKLWKDEYDDLLEFMLINFEFDFESAQKEFNKALRQVVSQTNSTNRSNLVCKEFSITELRWIWTYLEKTKFRNKKNTSKKVQAQLQKEEKQTLSVSQTQDVVAELQQITDLEEHTSNSNDLQTKIIENNEQQVRSILESTQEKLEQQKEKSKSIDDSNQSSQNQQTNLNHQIISQIKVQNFDLDSLD